MNATTARRTLALLALVLPIWLVGCAKKRPAAPAPASMSTAQAVRSEPPSGADGATEGNGGSAVAAQLKLIRTGQLELEVPNVERAIEELRTMAASSGALVAGSEIQRDPSGRASGRVTLKVPATGFDGSWQALKRLGKVERERISTEDVTKAYFDVETRLAVKRRTEARLRALLESSTGKLSEILEVERELDRVVVEIEQLLGEKRYYDERIELSTIVVELEEPRAMVRSSAAAPIVDALAEALEVLAESIATLIFAAMAALPWVVVASILLVLVRRARRRKKEAAKS